MGGEGERGREGNRSMGKMANEISFVCSVVAGSVLLMSSVDGTLLATSPCCCSHGWDMTHLQQAAGTRDR